jgi:hypothetical protein
MDYKDLKNVAKTRIYRSIFPNLPIEQWKLVHEVPGADFRFNDSLKDEPRVPHYFCAQYVYKDGKLSGLSEPQCISFDDSGRPVGAWGKKRPGADQFKIEYRKPE